MIPLHTSCSVSEGPGPEERAGPAIPRQEEGSAHPFPGLGFRWPFPCFSLLEAHCPGGAGEGPREETQLP